MELANVCMLVTLIPDVSTVPKSHIWYHGHCDQNGHKKKGKNHFKVHLVSIITNKSRKYCKYLLGILVPQKYFYMLLFNAIILPISSEEDSNTPGKGLW